MRPPREEVTRRITFVKKILTDGAPCRKCGEVEARLRETGAIGRIDRVVIADERDPESEGMALAARLGVKLAPFFIVEEGGNELVYESFMRFLKDVVEKPVSAVEEAKEILERNPDLDLL